MEWLVFGRRSMVKEEEKEEEQERTTEARKGEKEEKKGRKKREEVFWKPRSQIQQEEKESVGENCEWFKSFISPSSCFEF